MARLARWLPIFALSSALIAGAIGCNASDPPGRIGADSPHEKPATPPEITAVATTALGTNARVLSFGDLAHNGRRQVLAANGILATSNTERRIRITRAAILEQVGTTWVEVLRCDEYLKNASGFLVGGPREPVTSWQLEFGADSSDHRQDLRFTPLGTSGAASTSMPTVSVRWNPSVKRYQSVDPESGHFLQEAPSLETPVSPLR